MVRRCGVVAVAMLGAATQAGRAGPRNRNRSAAGNHVRKIARAQGVPPGQLPPRRSSAACGTTIDPAGRQPGATTCRQARSHRRHATAMRG